MIHMVIHLSFSHGIIDNLKLSQYRSTYEYYSCLPHIVVELIIIFYHLYSLEEVKQIWFALIYIIVPDSAC